MLRIFIQILATACGKMSQQLERGQLWLLSHRVFEPGMEFDHQASAGQDTWQRLSREGRNPCLLALSHWWTPWCALSARGGSRGQFQCSGPSPLLRTSNAIYLWPNSLKIYHTTVSNSHYFPRQMSTKRT